MTTYERWVKKRVLITARTYPVPSRKSIEVSCTAGITDTGEWIRLFPIPYRFLDNDKRFTKYQCIEANVTKSQSDIRPESFKIDIDSINILSKPITTLNRWEARKAEIFPLKSRSLCLLQSMRNQNQEPTLGLFKPKIISGLRIEPTGSKWNEAELACLKQYPLFGNMPRIQLEKLPYIFSYEFKCDNPGCPSHTLSCVDWEMGALFRRCRYKDSTNWEQKFRETYETKMILEKDTHFFVGTVHTHPDAWIIIGLFYPPK